MNSSSFQQLTAACLLFLIQILKLEVVLIPLACIVEL